MAEALRQLISQIQSSSESDDSDNEAASLALQLAAAASDDPVTKLLATLAIGTRGLVEALKDDTPGIKTGDLIRMKDDEATVTRLQEGHGGWNNDMRQDLGKIACVVRGSPGQDIVAHFGKKTWRLNPDVCVKLSKDDKKCMFKFGDEIYVEFTDKIAKGMQKSHGGWDGQMETDLQGIGKVIGTDDDGDVAVMFWTRCYRMNPATCKFTTTETGCSFQKGDRVFLDAELDVSVIKEFQESHRAWTPKIARILGRIGEVIDIDSDGDLVIKINDGKWVLHPEICTKIVSLKPLNRLFSEGDKVTISVDMDVVQQMQHEHGEWNDDMKKAEGKEGKIVKIFQNGDLHVDFGYKTWRLNAEVCSLTGQTKAGPAAKVGQKVAVDLPVEEFLRLQVGHGGINKSMITDIGKVGKILHVYEDRDVMVQFSPNMWCLNPAICTKLSDKPREKVSEGDQVYVGLPADFVETLQEGHGGFVDTMYRLLGKVGKVVRVLPTGDVAVRYGILPMVYHPALLSVVTTVDMNGVVTSTSSQCPFSPGDLVRVEMDVVNVQRLQKDHGGWNNEMLEIHGKVGLVDRVDASSGSVYVCYGQKFARLNPAVCTLVRSDQIQDNTSPASNLPVSSGSSTQAGGSATASASASSTTGPASLSSSNDNSNKCDGCAGRDIDIVFGCGHGACSQCDGRLKICPVCQAHITYRTKLVI